MKQGRVIGLFLRGEILQIYVTWPGRPLSIRWYSSKDLIEVRKWSPSYDVLPLAEEQQTQWPCGGSEITMAKQQGRSHRAATVWARKRTEGDKVEQGVIGAL